jgi:hypothetical protein
LDLIQSAKLGLFNAVQTANAYSILDTDYSNYAIVHLCESMFYGLRTRESIILLTRNITPSSEILARIKTIAWSFNYGGRPFRLAVERDPEICYGKFNISHIFSIDRLNVCFFIY